MKVLKFNSNERVVCFDCDDTLVMWDDKFMEPGPGKLPFIDSMGYKEEILYLTPHEKHIQKLKGHSKAGYYIIVWSAGGGAWAKAIVEGLGISEYVDYVTAKPVWIYDDLPLDRAIGTRRYYQPKKSESNEGT